MKYCFLILAMLLLPLTACGGMPSAAPAPSLIPLTATQLPPSETPTPASTETQPAPTVATDSYISQLEFTYESPLQQLKYNGAEIVGQTSVDASASIKNIGKVDFNNETMAETTLRAWMNIIHPELDDNDTNLANFAKELAAVQRAEPGASCDQVTRTISAFITDGGDKQSVTIAPDCGLSKPSDGTVILGKTRIVFGRWAATDNQTYIEKPIDGAPWLDVVTPGGKGAGMMIDEKTGELILFVSFTDNIENNPTHSVTTGVEILMRWLRAEMQGKRLSLNRSETEYNRGREWAGGVTVGK